VSARRELPSGAAFGRSLMQSSMAVSVIATAIMAGYLTTLLRLPADQLRGFVWIVAVLFLVLAVTTQWVNQRVLAPLTGALDALAAGDARPDTIQQGFAAAVDFPRRTFVIGMGWWILGGVLVVGAMRLFFPDFQLFSGAVMILAAASGGFVADVFLYFMLRERLEPIRSAFGDAIPDAALRGSLIQPVPLGRKLRWAFTGVTLVTVMFAVLLAMQRARRPVEELVIGAQHALLADLAARGTVGAGDLDAVAAQARRLGVADTLFVLDPESSPTPGAHRDAGPTLTEGELRFLASGGEVGDSRGVDMTHGFAWRRLADGRVLVALTGWGAMQGEAASLRWVFTALIAFAGLVAFGVAWIIGRDVGAASRALCAEAERIAAGDLTVRPCMDSEDELGALARAFGSMTDGLRATIARVVDAADRVESAAGEIASAAESVAGVTVDQVRGIQQATVGMESIHREVGGITESAQALNVSVEESSSSVLELGAVGEELNQTASVLSTKVDEVSSSIEQMIRSVRQVAQNAEALASAAAETSTSMVEMAASMREVDTNAAETAKLSARVVASSESGRERVLQTIEGMAGIREATEIAERVIRSLGERTQEIGTIVGVIDDVADETNLLALNAAIIAAQAGDHGRAFSVVADQIKDLADRVLASTKEIGGLIRAVQEEGANAIGAVERGSEKVQEGVDLSAEAGVSLEEITAASRESGERIAEIVTAVREQAKAAGHVVELMDRVRSGVEQIRAAGQEQERGNELVLRNSEAMRDVSQQVRATTEEQSRGSGRICESVESVRDAVEQIHRSLQEQSAACREAASNLERVYERTRTNEESARRMGEAMQGLVREAEQLRDGVQRFRI
jgi:methyl-accepting chemotaxis protein